MASKFYLGVDENDIEALLEMMPDLWGVLELKQEQHGKEPRKLKTAGEEKKDF
jgi:hypothetical protein